MESTFENLHKLLKDNMVKVENKKHIGMYKKYFVIIRKVDDTYFAYSIDECGYGDDNLLRLSKFDLKRLTDLT